MSVDQFFTPRWIANAMVRRVRNLKVTSVADFSAGDGALLDAAIEKWPNATVYAADIDRRSVEYLKRRHPHWNVSKCDFMSETSRDVASCTRYAGGGVDLILLNPPFSCRGARTVSCNINGNTVKCSTAVSFVITAFEFLHPDGELVALLPHNSLSSEKDRSAWAQIAKQFVIATGVATRRCDFEGCYVRSRIVHLRRRRKGVNTVLQEPLSPVTTGSEPVVLIVRGSIQMHIRRGEGRPLVHTTNLRDYRVILNGHAGARSRPSVVGPCVLVPRVGQPNISKVALFLRRRRVALSDCVIGLQCKCKADAEKLHTSIINDPIGFHGLYSGTCATYTTVERLREYLQARGYAASQGNPNIFLGQF